MRWPHRAWLDPCNLRRCEPFRQHFPATAHAVAVHVALAHVSITTAGAVAGAAVQEPVIVHDEQIARPQLELELQRGIVDRSEERRVGKECRL